MKKQRRGLDTYNVTDGYGVSLLSEMSIIFTFILNRRLKAWSEANDVIGNEQAGFREQHTTIDQMFCLYTIIT